MRTPIAFAGLALAGALLLAGCHSSGGSTPSAGSSASARASVLASELKHDNKLLKDETKAISEVEACAKSQAGLTVVIPVPGSSTQPSISGVKYHDVAHPLDTTRAILLCTPAGKRGPAAMEACARQIVLSGGFGKGVLMADLNAAATQCVAGIKS
jgi:hypothetical protein